MITYYYDQVEGGYRWNMLQRIYNSIGIEPIGSGDTQLKDETKTYLQFSEELTEEQKNSIDEIMSSNPTYPPQTNNTVAIISDIWNEKNTFKEAIGLHYETYYDESIRESGNINQIKLVFGRNLTEEEKNKVRTEYGKLIKF